MPVWFQIVISNFFLRAYVEKIPTVHWLVEGTTDLLGVKQAYQGTTDRHSYQRQLCCIMGNTGLSEALWIHHGHWAPPAYQGTICLSDTQPTEGHQAPRCKGHHQWWQSRVISTCQENHQLSGSQPAYQRHDCLSGDIAGVSEEPLANREHHWRIRVTTDVAGLPRT